MWAALRGQFAGRLTVASAMVSRHVLEGALPVTAAAQLVRLGWQHWPSQLTGDKPTPSHSEFSPIALRHVFLCIVSIAFFSMCFRAHDIA